MNDKEYLGMIEKMMADRKFDVVTLHSVWVFAFDQYRRLRELGETEDLNPYAGAEVNWQEIDEHESFMD